MLHDMGEEDPTFERIRSFCTAPDRDGLPYLALPTAFKLDLPTGYFLTNIKARQDDLLQRSAWEAAFRVTRLDSGRPGGGC